MNKAERQALIVTHPGVRKLKAATQCEGFVSGTPMREIYNWGPGRKNPPLPRRTCKNPAWWRFTALKRKRSYGWEGARNLCWSHLIHQGVYGDMDEDARTQRWMARLEKAGRV